MSVSITTSRIGAEINRHGAQAAPWRALGVFMRGHARADKEGAGGQFLNLVDLNKPRLAAIPSLSLLIVF